MADLVTAFPQLDVVSSGSGGGSIHNYDVTVVGGDYVLNGILGLQIFPEAGHTYVFDLSDASLDAHPFLLSDTVDGTWGPDGTSGNADDGVEYTTGVTKKPNATDATRIDELTLVADSSTPNVLYYYCNLHPAMGNDVLDPLFASSEILLATDFLAGGSDAGAMNNVDFNEVIAEYLHHSDDESVLTEAVNITSVNFDINLDASLALATTFTSFTSAVDTELTGWSTSGFLRLTVHGEELLTPNAVDTNNDTILDGDAYFGGSELIDSFTLEAVVVNGGTETTQMLFSKTFATAVKMNDISLDYDLTKGDAERYT